MKKFLTSVLFFCFTCVSAADMEIASLVLQAQGLKPLTCVVSMDEKAEVSVFIGDVCVGDNDDLIAAIQNGTLTYAAALALLKAAAPPTLTKNSNLQNV